MSAPSIPIALGPADWFLATWRTLDPLPCPAPEPFDLQKRLATMANMTSANEDTWNRAALNPGMSSPEARLWYEVLSQCGPACPPAALRLRLLKNFDDRLPGRPEIFSRLRRNPDHIPPHIVIPLVRLTSPADVIEIGLSSDLDRASSSSSRPSLSTVLRLGIQQFLIPYLDQVQRDQLRDLLRERLRDALPIRPNTSGLPTIPNAALLAAAFGLHAELDAIVSAWPDTQFQRRTAANPETKAQWLIFGLGSPDAVRHHVHRLKLRLVETRHVRAWLANTELADLAFIRDSVLACTTRGAAERVMAGFSLVGAPEAAPLMVELKLAGKSPQEAIRWLEEDPARTTAGLANLAATRTKPGEAARQALRDLARAGHTETIETALDQAGAAGRIKQAVTEQVEPLSTPFDDDNTPAWLAQATFEQLGGKPARLPRWLTIEHMPPLRLGEHHLNTNQAHAAINALRESTLQRQMPLVNLLKERADPASCDAFAWSLCERWLQTGAPSADRWALMAVGLWGGDGSAVKLAPLVRNWPGQKQARRALHGLECLRAIGTETALLELSGIAQKIRFRSLQQTASGFMMQIASERRLTTAQLEDRIVPTLDLDARGSRVFDFGARNFRLVLGHHLRPMLCDDTGKVRDDLPKPGAKDDQVKAPEAVAAWKVFKKQIREVLKVQQTRLESAMLSVRRWGVKEFETWIVRHPLMGLLAQGILWGGLDAKNHLARTFRVTEDRTCADRHEAVCSLEGLAGVVIVHPLHLGDDERRAWLEVFADHEVLPSFEQLTRPVYRLQPEERNQTVLRRYDGKAIPPFTLIDILDRLGWDRDQHRREGSRYGPMTTAHLRYFHQAGLTAVLCYRDGIIRMECYDPSWPNQTLAGCFFVRGLESPSGGFQTSQAIPLGNVDPILLSEVLTTLETLSSKAV